MFGGEYSLGRFGVFAETRAIIPFPLPAPFPSLRVGANVYFVPDEPAAEAVPGPLGSAQPNYLGVSVSVTDDFGLKLLLGVRAGRLLAERVTLRGGLELSDRLKLRGASPRATCRLVVGWA